MAKGERSRLLEGIIVLVRNTTWKCGRVERAVLECLQNDVRGRGKARIKDLLRRLEEIREKGGDGGPGPDLQASTGEPRRS